MCTTSTKKRRDFILSHVFGLHSSDSRAGMRDKRGMEAEEQLLTSAAREHRKKRLAGEGTKLFWTAFPMASLL